MSRVSLFGVGFWLLLTCSGCSYPQRPNVLLIVADDLGYTDLGVYGSEIETPKIDALAKSGLLLTNFRAAPTCSPSRAMLLTGVDSHLAGLGTMAERRTSVHEGRRGYEGHLSSSIVTLAERLKAAGYATYMSGKWHLGLSPETNPASRGFERSFAMLEGGAAHFSSRPMQDPEITGQAAARFTEDGLPADIPDDFYSSDFYTDRLIQYIESGAGDKKPFFAFLSYTAPHWPLQAHASSIEHYRGYYDAGYDAIYSARLERLRDSGILPTADEFPRTGNQQPWTALSEKERLVEARRMQVYAAMIHDVDENVGKIIEFLHETGQYDNTFILFMSDNGPEGRSIDEQIRAVGDWPHRCCDNRLENIGNPDSYTWLGPNWSRVSAGPFRGRKGNASDGGLRVPAIISYPSLGHTPAVSDAWATVLDVLPTVLDATGIDTEPLRKGRRNSIAPSGTSIMPVLVSQQTHVHAQDDFVGWELSGRRALLSGDWKLLWDSEPFGKVGWSLYNVRQDPAELQDLSEDEPEKRAYLKELWNRYVEINNVYMPQ